MDMQTLTVFLMWCTIIDCGLMIIWTLIFRFSPDLVYRSQKLFFPTVTKDQFNLIIYSFLGFFKIIFLIFIAVPFVVLLMIS